jgi:pyridoxal 5'-phosphate synthase pdxS subunit
MASTQNGTTPHSNGTNGGSNDFTVKAGLAQMLKGGVIMDVVNVEQVRHCPSLR